MRLRTAIGLTMTVLLVGTVSALAFQQEQAPPMEEPARLAPSDNDPGLALGAPAGKEAGKKEGGGIFGFGIWSKLNFGLDLLYSEQPEELQESSGTVEEEQDDVSVLAKIKRLF